MIYRVYELEHTIELELTIFTAEPGNELLYTTRKQAGVFTSHRTAPKNRSSAPVLSCPRTPPLSFDYYSHESNVYVFEFRPA